jgi:nucleotidyltransferase/DNA polymerase involved in DNA repair
VAAIDRGQERAFLGELPLTLLPDVDPHLALTFNVLGLRTIGQLAALPARAVKQRFGVQGERLHRYAHGIDERPVVPSATQASIATRYECEDGTMEEAMQGLRTLAERCAAELARLGTAGRLIGLTLIWEEAAVPSLRLLQGEEDGVPPPRRALPPGVARQGGQVLPIPYRVHSSRLPQPPVEERGEPGSVDLPVTAPAPPSSPSEPTGRSSKAVAVARTPIDTAAALLDRAERLLEQCRPHADDGAAVPRLQAIELKVSEFTQPAQLSFADFDRLDQTGALRGLSVERRRALAHEDEIFEARYGSAAFRHVTGVDPGNILTERRFRWQSGLPWEGGEAKRKRP